MFASHCSPQLRSRRTLLIAVLVAAGSLLLLPAAFAAVPAGAVRSVTGSVSADAPEVLVTGGSITGLAAASTAGWSYRGIPFAAPPVANLRWRPPQAVVPWAGVRACTQYGPVCPQKSLTTSTFAAAPAAAQTQSEDCLYLNVDTPSATLSDHLPVMVFIYGGSFLNGSGSAPLYNGASLNKNGVVVVTFNYRLGPFGFMALPQLTAESPHHSSGNYGLLDQIAALQWVQGNIAKFGGDPGNVTIFGESAGACSVLDLMASPLTKDQHLFSKAISESAPNADSGIVIYSTRPLATGEAQGQALAKALGCAGQPDQLAAMRNVSTAALLAAANPRQRLFQTTAAYTFQPYVDGYVLPKDPVQAFAEGDFRHVPTIVGSNREEANIGWPVIAAENVAKLQAPLSQVYGPYADQLYALFPPKTSGGLKQSLLDTVTLSVFTAPAQYFAGCVARSGQPAYNYIFTGWPLGYPLEACHTAELPYVFGNDYLGFDPTAGDAGVLTTAMQQYWTSFAASGDPNASGRLQWPTFSAASPTTMMLQPSALGGLSTVQGYQAKECAVADQLFAPELGPGRPDKVGPGAWVALSPRPVHSGWWRFGVRVTLTASDGARGSGVRRIEYRRLTLAGAPAGGWTRYRGQFAIRAAGINRFAFRAIDRAGNAGVTKRFTVKVAAGG